MFSYEFVNHREFLMVILRKIYFNIIWYFVIFVGTLYLSIFVWSFDLLRFAFMNVVILVSYSFVHLTTGPWRFYGHKYSCCLIITWTCIHNKDVCLIVLDILSPPTLWLINGEGGNIWTEDYIIFFNLLCFALV